MNNLLFISSSELSPFFVCNNGTLEKKEGAEVEFDEPTDIIFGAGIQKISNNLFKGCKNLRTVKFLSDCDSSEVIIGNSAFSRCEGLKEVVLSENIKQILARAFSECNNLKVSFLSNPKEIKVQKTSFEYCEDVTFVIPYGCEDDTFENLELVTYTVEHEDYFVSGHIRYHRLDDKTVSIANNQSLRLGISNLNISNSEVSDNNGDKYLVTSIEEDAFRGNAIVESVDLPESLTSLSSSAFASCPNLSSFRFPNNKSKNDSLSIIDGILYAKTDKGLSLITCPPNLNKEIIILPDNLTSIEDYAFSCVSKLKRFYFNKRIDIKENAFAESDLDDCYAILDGILFEDSEFIELLENTFTVVQEEPTFKDDDDGNEYSIITNAIKDGLNSSDNEVALVKWNKISRTTIPSIINFAGFPYNVVKICEDAFVENSKLKKLTIPQNVRVIENNPFRNCSGDVNVTIESGSEYKRNESLFTYKDEKLVFCISNEDELTIPADTGITHIGKDAFASCPNLTTINVEDLEGVAFDGDPGCKNSIQVVVPVGKFDGHKNTAWERYFELKQLFDLTLDRNSLIVVENKSAQVNIKSGNGNYSVSSNDPSVVTVSQENDIIKVKGGTEGKTTIKVTDIETSQTQDISVTVVKALSVGTTKLCILEGDAPKVTIKQGSRNYSVTSDNTPYVTASVKGSEITITGVKEGTATVTVTDNDTSLNKDISITVVKALSVGVSQLTIFKGDAQKVTIKQGSGNYSVTSNKPTCLTVSVKSNEITLTGVNAGNAIVTVKDKDTSLKESIIVNVWQRLSISSTSCTIVKNTFETISIKSGSGNYSAFCSDDTIVTPSVTGSKITLRGVNVGNAKVTIKDEITSLTQDISISVQADLAIPVDKLTMYENSSKEIIITQGSGKYSVTSSKKTYVEVSIQGDVVLVKGKKSGQAIVTVTDEVTSQTVKISIKVEPPLSIGVSEISVAESQTRTIAIRQGSGHFSVTSDNTSYVKASVEEREITLTGVKEGTAIVTVTDIDTSQTQDIAIKIVKSLSIGVSEISVAENKTRTISIQKGSGHFSVTSDNTSYVKASVKGSEITLTGVKEGTAKVTVTDIDTSQTQDVAIKIVKSLSIGVSEISVAESQTRTIAIQQGSGNYSVTSGNQSYVTASVSRNVITLSGKFPGTTTVTVTDIDTSQTQDISITVVKSLSVGVTKISVAENKTRTISIQQGSGRYSVTSGNQSYVTTTVKGNVITLLGKRVGTITITVTDDMTSLPQKIIVSIVKPLSVGVTSYNVLKNQSSVISIQQGSGSYSVISGNTSYVKASVKGSEITLTGVEEGTAIVTFKDDETLIKQEVTVSVVGQFSRPTTASSTVSRPTTASSTVSRPTTTSSTVSRPTTASSTVSRPTTASSTVSRPTTTSSTVSRPTTASSTFTRPTTSSTDTTFTRSSSESNKSTTENREGTPSGATGRRR